MADIGANIAGSFSDAFFGAAAQGNANLRAQGLIYKKINVNSYVLENLLPYYMIIIGVAVLFLYSLWKSSYLLSLAMLAGIVACLYVISKRWRRFNTTQIYGGNYVLVRSQYNHGLKVGDKVELIQDNPAPNASHTCNTDELSINQSIDGETYVEMIFDEYSFVTDKVQTNASTINPGWWRKL